MRFLLVNGTWECLIFDFSFFWWNHGFYLSISDAVFLVTSFSIFDHSVWLILSFRCAHFYLFIQIDWGSGRPEADLRCGECLSEKSCRHLLVVSTSFWSWLLKVSSVLTSLKYTATFYLGS